MDAITEVEKKFLITTNVQMLALRVEQYLYENVYADDGWSRTKIIVISARSRSASSVWWQCRSCHSRNGDWESSEPACLEVSKQALSFKNWATLVPS